MQTAQFLTLPGDRDGVRARELEELFRSRRDSHMAEGDFNEENILYVRKLTLAACRGELEVSDEVLERLRLLCQLWNIELRPREITSHRPVIGPIIVAVKKAIYPLVQFFLKDLIRQQRDFNAASIRLFAEVLSERTHHSVRTE